MKFAYYSYFEVYPLHARSGKRHRNVSPVISKEVSRHREGLSYGDEHYTWLRARELERRQHAPIEEGVHSINHWRCFKRLGVPGQKVEQYRESPEVWPPEIEEGAKHGRIHHYHRLRSCEESIEFLRRTFSRKFGSGEEFRLSVFVNEAWYDPPGGVIPISDAPIIATHSIPISGFGQSSAHPEAFAFPNSWGSDWGDRGIGYLSKAAYQKYALAAWHIDGLGFLPPLEPYRGVQCVLWKAVPLGDEFRSVHGREIIDCDTGERLAWAFCRVHGEFLDIEEFFVWPSERNKGYGRKLAEMIQELQRQSRKKTRAWIPYADAEPENKSNLDAAMNLLGLYLHNSPEIWASFVALEEAPVGTLLKPFIPSRPASMREELNPCLYEFCDAEVEGEHTMLEYGGAGPKEGDTELEFGNVEPEVDEPLIYRVWYGTNRQLNQEDDPFSGYGTKRDSNRVHYGTVDVAIPKSHDFGSIGSGWYERWRKGEDDRLTIQSIDPKNENVFWRDFQQELNQQPGDSLVFIHGYNVDFHEAAIRAAQIGFDLKIAGETAFFSWPSCGGLLRYNADEATIEASEQQIAEFLAQCVEIAAPFRVHIIAHSMGNRGLLRALQRLLEGLEFQTKKAFGQIILAAPDLDVDVFRSLSNVYTKFGERTTLYASPGDMAVKISRIVHKYSRAGFTPPVTVVPEVDTVVVPKFNLLDLGHGYFAEAEGVLHDIFELIRHGSEPKDRQRLFQSQTDVKEAYWEMRG